MVWPIQLQVHETIAKANKCFCLRLVKISGHRNTQTASHTTCKQISFKDGKAEFFPSTLKMCLPFHNCSRNAPHHYWLFSFSSDQSCALRSSISFAAVRRYLEVFPLSSSASALCSLHMVLEVVLLLKTNRQIDWWLLYTALSKPKLSKACTMSTRQQTENLNKYLLNTLFCSYLHTYID